MLIFTSCQVFMHVKLVICWLKSSNRLYVETGLPCKFTGGGKTIFWKQLPFCSCSVCNIWGFKLQLISIASFWAEERERSYIYTIHYQHSGNYVPTPQGPERSNNQNNLVWSQQQSPALNTPSLLSLCWRRVNNDSNSLVLFLKYKHLLKPSEISLFPEKIHLKTNRAK